MEGLLVFLGLGIVMIMVYFAKASNSTVSGSKGGRSPRVSMNNRQADIIRQVNEVVDREQPKGEAWREDPVTDRQMEFMSELFDENSLSFSIKSGELTKGQASDIIGLFMEPDEFHLDVLKFFKVEGYRKMKQTQAKEAVRTIFESEENIKAWENRPPSKEQKDALRFMGEKVPKGMTHTHAEEKLGKLAEANEEKFEELETRLDLLDTVNDRDFREDYDCKKISWNQLNEAVDELLQIEGAIDKIDEDMVIEKAMELHPNLGK